MIGRTLSHYRIVEALGSGGMGDVYIAEDTKLSRKVALKVLPEALATDERLSRFELEAKAVAALNHPNIVHVYSVEEVDGVHFITMELVRGHTLTDLLPTKGFSLAKFFELATPLADAVATAHEAGIIHRDLKPDNVMVTDEGRVKILDFGLAKPMDNFLSESDDSDYVTKTREGVIQGTVHYMSPEQAAGKPVEPSSDIFSLSIVFHEMLTGRNPFGGDTPTEVISAIIQQPARPVREMREDVPRELSKLIERGLNKDRTRRPQSALEIRNALEELKVAWSSGELTEAPPQLERTAPGKWIAAALTAAVVVGALVYLTRPSADTIVRLANPTQLTRGAEVEDFPVVSPDGQMVAYRTGSTNALTGRDIWVARIGSGRPVNRTEELPGPNTAPSWSPDGSEIAFASGRDEDGQLLVVPVLAGSPRRVAAGVDSPQWSRDGTELAYLVADESGHRVLEIRALDTGAVRRLALPGASPAARSDLSGSPDGRFFAYMEGNHQWQVTRLWLLRVSDGEAFPITDGLMNDHSPSWSPDGRSLYFVSNRGGSRDLWQQRLGSDGTPQGEPKAVTTGVGIREASVSSDGTKLTYSKGGLVANVWRVPILSDRPAAWADAEQITFDEAYIEHLDVSPDGERLLISSDHAGNPDIWALPAAGGELQQLTSDRTPDWSPRWSPDGEQIAFYAFRSGNRDIWVMPTSGGPATQVTTREADDSYPSWSADGREIAFGSSHGGERSVWVVSAGGGEPRQITTPGHQPAWSPDGETLFFEHGWRVPATGGEAEQIVHGMTGNETGRWSKDGTEVFVARTDDDGRNFWAVSVNDGSERQLTALQGRRGLLPLYGPATDGNYLYFTWEEELGDIWVMDVVQN